MEVAVENENLDITLMRGNNPSEPMDSGILSGDAPDAHDGDSIPLWMYINEFYPPHVLGSHDGLCVSYCFWHGQAGSSDDGDMLLNFGLPAWFVALLLAIYPNMRILKHRKRQRRRRAGKCVICGYDLRGSPDQCPECGTEREVAVASWKT
jgi:hypothetical protein